MQNLPALFNLNKNPLPCAGQMRKHIRPQLIYTNSVRLTTLFFKATLFYKSKFRATPCSWEFSRFSAEKARRMLNFYASPLPCACILNIH